MNKFLLILCIALASYSYSQEDSLIIQNTEQTTGIQDLRILMSDCAHGHVCCQAGCSCCPELNRKQAYDTVQKKTFDNITRYTVVERYGMASSHEVGSVKYLFRNKKNEWKSYYSLLASQHFGGYIFHHSSDDAQSKVDYSSYFKNGAAYVFDHERNYYLINEKGEELPIPYDSKNEIAPGVFRVSKIIWNKRIYGLVGKKDEIHTPLKFTLTAYTPGDSFIIFAAHNGKKGVFNLQGETLIPTEYTEIERLSDKLLIGRTYGKSTLFSANGTQLTKEEYNYMSDLSDGLIAIRNNDKIGFINEKGEEVITPKFDWAYDFNDGRAAVYNGEKWGFINKQGELVVPYRYDLVRTFNDERAAVAIGSNSNKDKWGVIDLDGNYIVDPLYDEIAAYKNGFAKIQVNGSGYGFIDTKGKEIIKPVHFVQAGSPSTDFPFNKILLRKTGKDIEKHFLADKKGKELLDLSKYKDAYWLNIRNPDATLLPYLRVTDMRNLRGLIDLEGNKILPQKYRDMVALTDQFMILVSDSTTTFYNLKNKEILNTVNGHMQENQVDGVIRMGNQKGETFYVNLEGKLVEPH